jgi:ubiquinol-cytochrome c reductase iron-sulfur subunit
VDRPLVEARHPIASSPEDREVTVSGFMTGLDETGIARRPLVRNTLLGALGVLALPVPIVLLRDLGPLPGDSLKSTIWEPGMRVVRDVTGTPIRVSDMQFGDLINAEPAIFFENDEEGEPLIEGADLQREKAKAAVILVRMEPEEITPADGREDWSVDGILCYSKICTHVGCPISLYERTTHNVLCPCHQSTFDLADNAKVVFGPAARPLPQLPLGVDSEGFLVAQSDFDEPVGPSFWERDSR